MSKDCGDSSDIEFLLNSIFIFTKFQNNQYALKLFNVIVELFIGMPNNN